AVAEEYGVFTTSPTATETAAARLFRRFAPSGVVPPGAGHGIDGGDALAVTADGTAGVTVGSGYAIVGGYWYRNTEPLKKAIIPNPGGQSRWDRLVVRADPAEDQCSLEWLEGTPGSSSPPDPTRTTDGIWEEPLCRVLLAPGATSVAPEEVSAGAGESNGGVGIDADGAWQHTARGWDIGPRGELDSDAGSRFVCSTRKRVDDGAGMPAIHQGGDYEPSLDVGKLQEEH